MADLECVALHGSYRALKLNVIEQAHALGCAVLAWTVNDQRTARRLLAAGADCLVTDRLDRIAPDFSAP
jgi:glycerophosphoryl diester phosphodiesterase